MAKRLPVFPLGTVLVPYGLIPLHIFEPRYRILMNDLLGGGPVVEGAEPEMGVVLIERGREVGGGEERAEVGTIARILRAERLPDGRFAVVAAGVRPFWVACWLPDDPYPLAEIEELPTEVWDPEWDFLLASAESEVRRALALAGELADVAPLPDLSGDPLVASWQLCAAAPVGAFDRQRLLTAALTADRLELLAEQAREAADIFSFRLGRA